MASLSAEVDIQATPTQILDVLADLQHYPDWSAVHKRARVETSFDDGRPKRAVMAVAAVGLTDEQTLDYEWSADGVKWSLVKAAQQRNQHGSYAISKGSGGTSHVRYDLDIDPLFPMPGFIVKQVMRKAVESATKGLKSHIESL